MPGEPIDKKNIKNIKMPGEHIIALVT